MSGRSGATFIALEKLRSRRQGRTRILTSSVRSTSKYDSHTSPFEIGALSQFVWGKFGRIRLARKSDNKRVREWCAEIGCTAQLQLQYFLRPVSNQLSSDRVTA